MTPVYVLGINAYHGDVSAVLLRDGELVAAVEEERFRRIKHVAGFPEQAIQACLAMAGISGRDVQHVAVSRNPRAHLWRKALFAMRRRPGADLHPGQNGPIGHPHRLRERSARAGKPRAGGKRQDQQPTMAHAQSPPMHSDANMRENRGKREPAGGGAVRRS